MFNGLLNGLRYQVWDGVGMSDSMRIPPDGQESAALLKHVEDNNIPDISWNLATLRRETKIWRRHLPDL